MWGQEGRDGDETSKPEGTPSRRVPGGDPTGLPGGAGNRRRQEGRRREPLTYLPRAAGALEPPAVPGRGRQPGAAGLRGRGWGGGDGGPGPERRGLCPRPGLLGPCRTRMVPLTPSRAPTLSRAGAGAPGGPPRALTASPSVSECVLASGHREAPGAPSPLPPPDLEPRFSRALAARRSLRRCHGL